MMEWGRLISTKRLGQEDRHGARHDDRSEFKRDYDRLVFSAPFRRLQNKTQVFPLPGSVFVHNRLTHSLEVASVGMSLANDVARELNRRHPALRDTMVGEIGQIVSAACLAHDLGNPPFGHSGERAIQTFFTEGGGEYVRGLVSDAFWADITRFEGNANAFRLLAHRFCGRRRGGFAMTYSMLAAIVKYPFESVLAHDGGKFGFFHSERDIYRTIADELGIERLSRDGEPLRYARHPLVYLVEAADDICYELMDIEDAGKLMILSFGEIAELLLGFFGDTTREQIRRRIADEQITDDNEKVAYMRACVVGALERACVNAFIANEDAILAGTFPGSLLGAVPERLREAYGRCAAVSQRKIYLSKPVLDVELSGCRIMENLMEKMIDAAVHPERFYSRQLAHRVSSQYDINSPDLETRIMAALDYISGMTDVYALEIYQKINGISLPIV